jgi:hypothetical protein
LAEIVPVVSEALEKQIRDLLPSQRGFGEDLQASNVITPIIDLTATALGTQTPQNLQTALDAGVTQTTATATTTNLTATPGFYSILASAHSSSGTYNTWNISVTDGFTTTVVASQYVNNLGAYNMTVPLVVFVASGETLTMSLGTGVTGRVTFRQIADVNGNLVNPIGFTPQ